MRNNTNAVLH